MATITNVSVRPVRWNKLLDAIELIYGKDEVDLGIFETYMGVSSQQSLALARSLYNMGFISMEGTTLKIQHPLNTFVRLWEQGDLRGISHLLQHNFRPFFEYVSLVKEKGPIQLPTDIETKKVLAQKLAPFGLNVASFEILTRLASPLGTVYVSHDCVYFAENVITQEEFNQALLAEYKRFSTPDGYASMSDVADAVCRKLNISMLAFDKYFKVFYDTNLHSLETSSSIMVTPKTQQKISTLQKRGNLPRFDNRRLVDGVNVYQVNIKAFKVI